jgi:hypothetical protein
MIPMMQCGKINYLVICCIIIIFIVRVLSDSKTAVAQLLRSWVRIPPGEWIFVCCECRVLSGRGLCDELITRSEESYRLCCVVVCDLEISRIGAPYTYAISNVRVNTLTDLFNIIYLPYNKLIQVNLYSTHFTVLYVQVIPNVSVIQFGYLQDVHVTQKWYTVKM